jgi:hypothetical protein
MAVKFCSVCGHTVPLPHTCKKREREPQILYAFWKYDICPYMLGGVVERFRENGYVVPRGYSGMSFKPIAIIPDHNGADTLRLLEELKSEYSTKEKELKQKYAKAALNLVGLEE